MGSKIKKGEGSTSSSEKEPQLEWRQSDRIHRNSRQSVFLAGLGVTETDAEGQTTEQENNIFKEMKMTDLESAPMLSEPRQSFLVSSKR